MSKQAHRAKLYRLYLNFAEQDNADFLDRVAHSAANNAYTMERNNYWLQWGETWTWRDVEQMRAAA